MTHALAGTTAAASTLLDVASLTSRYYELRPDPNEASQRVAFGTSGHRGSAFNAAFNEWHILAIAQAICEHRKERGIDGPLYLGIDTHALSQPAFESALEVLAANGVDVMLAKHTPYTPTPVVSHAILTHNRGRSSGLADGIVITPSHNPPEDGGFKYDPPHGGPAESAITSAIETRANELLHAKLAGVARMPFEKARAAATTHEHDYLNAYVDDLESVVDMAAIRDAKIELGVDPLGGAGVAYWPRIAERYRLAMTVVDTSVDPTFRFVSLDWDGRIRMDPSSSFSMQRLIGLKDRFDLAFACDADHDRHGIVTRRAGLLPPNHYLCACIDYLVRNRESWNGNVAIGKTVVSSSMVDRVVARAGRTLYEVPVGFKWFVDGLFGGTVGFAGEESAGSAFLRRNGSVWTTDKDGIIAGLLSAEMTVRDGRDPGERYAALAAELGDPVYDRISAPANGEQKARLAKLSADDVRSTQLAGDDITEVSTHAPGNGAAIGGVKVSTANGWFAARPSGTEDMYKIYAESFAGSEHLERIQAEAQRIVSQAIAS